jgi:hypothetical protein
MKIDKQELVFGKRAHGTLWCGAENNGETYLAGTKLEAV